MNGDSVENENEFFALDLGLQGIHRKNPEGSDSAPGRMLDCNPRTGRCSGCTPAEPYPPSRENNLANSRH